MVTLLQVKSHDNLSVTAIIPTFRSENVIIRALNSVLNQTCPPNEVIIVDDASDDQTVVVIREFMKNYPQIRLIVNSKNQGPGQSRNTAWHSATTEFIAFLDADDTWHPSKLGVQLEWFKQNPRETICGTQHRIFDQPEIADATATVSNFTLKDLLHRNRFTTPSAMLRREISIRFDPKLRLSEDYLLWMEIAAKYGHVSRINKPLTILHKPEFGAKGLSSKIFAMYFGEMTTLTILRKKRQISIGLLSRSYIWSTIKMIRRLPLAVFRKMTWKTKA